jgi:putative transposase
LPAPITDHLHHEVLRQPIESAQYTSIRYATRLADVGALASIGSVGDSYDNALAESTIGLYKAECVDFDGPWHTVEELELATLIWVDWWNETRLHSAIGDIPPVEYEQHYHQQQHTPGQHPLPGTPSAH